MKKILLPLYIAVSMISGCKQSSELTFDFEKENPNTIAKGWSNASSQSQTQQKIEIVNADGMNVDRVHNARKLVGNVKLRQGNITIECDSALFYHFNAVDAFGQVNTYDNNKEIILKYDGYHHFGEGIADWEIVDDHGNKVFAQLQSENPKTHFNITVYDALKMADVELSVKFKAVQGTLDQGGGFVWRYQDESNHYIVRANPLENNVVLFKMEKGVRTNLPLVGVDSTYGMDVSPMGTDWHTLGLTVQGDLFTVLLNGKELFKVKDSTFTTAGKIGLWTKADAVTYFDELHIRSMN